MCEAGVGYDDEEVYPGALLRGGTLVVSTGFGGVATSMDGCGFVPWLPNEAPFVADVRALPTGPGVVALEARSVGEAFVNQLWHSADGFNWRELGLPLPVEEPATSFAISNEGALFVGISGANGAALLRSADSGETWEQSLLTSELGVSPRVVGAYGAAEQARVFLVADAAQAEGISTGGDRALLSTDGGRTFSTLLQAEGDLSSWALSSDGERLAVGGHADGIFVLRGARTVAAGATMTKAWDHSVHALAWSADGRLYAAGHEVVDGFSVGVSEDDGRSFQSVFALCQVQGPLACADDTSVGAQCSSSGETGWDVRKEVADPAACAPAPEPSAEPGKSQSPNPQEGALEPAGGATATPRSEASCGLAPAAAKGGLTVWLLAAMLALVGRRQRDARRVEIRT